MPGPLPTGRGRTDTLTYLLVRQRDGMRGYPHLLISREFLTGPTGVPGSQPSPRNVHVEACRPRGYVPIKPSFDAGHRQLEAGDRRLVAASMTQLGVDHMKAG